MKQPMGVILAGGLATRMGGGDKCLLPIGGRPLLSHVLDRIAPQVDQIILNANGDASRFSNFNLPVEGDQFDGFAGPLSGVLTGLEWAAAQDGTHIVTVAADTPFFPCDLVPQLLLNANDAGLCLAKSPSGMQPTFGLWPVALRDDLRAALENGVRKVLRWTDDHAAGVAEFSDDTAFFNVNTPDDLRTAEDMI